MTTAHRATWKAARGGLQEEGSFRLHVPSAAVSAKDAPTEQSLKLRADPQQSHASRQALRAALESSERAAAIPARKRARFELAPAPELALRDAVPHEFRTPLIEATRHLDRDAELDDGQDSDEEEDKLREQRVNAPHDDAGPGDGGQRAVHESEEGEDEEEDSDDDEAELLAELERIRRERAFERAKKQSEEQERLEREQTAKAAAGNPLMPNLGMFNDEISDTASIATGSVAAFAVKRRWDDDVIFRNQARGERKDTPRFINDTIRNDFHRRFMKKYMR